MADDRAMISEGLSQSEVRKCLMANNTIHLRSLAYFSPIG